MAPYNYDPVIQGFYDFVAKQGGPGLVDLDVVGARNLLETVQKHERADDVVTEELGDPVSVKSSRKSLIYKPVGASGDLKTVIYFHGGGWVLGSPNTHDRLIRDLVRESGLAFVFIYYTPAPDKQFPDTFEEVFEVVQWVQANGAKKGLKTDKFAFAGDSAGGHMSIAMSNYCIERNGPKVVFQAIVYPVTDLAHESSTFKDFADNPALSAAAIRWVYHHWIPNSDDRLDYHASPILMTKEQAAKQPPTLLITADVDCLREEGELFGRLLQKAGVQTSTFRALGASHDFCMINGVAGSPTTQATVEFVAWKLKKSLR